MARRVIAFILLCTCLYGCQLASLTQPLATPTLVFEDTPTPTTPLKHSPTPLPRWVTYQTALAAEIINSPDALCEFELLGVSETGKEVYMWALCEAKDPRGAGGSVPAVIHLRENGEIEKIDIPISGVHYPKDIERLFPPEIAERVIQRDLLGYSNGDHLNIRRTINVPPLMIVAGTPLP